MKILIIDDSYEIRDVLRLIIERHNHEVVEAVDGQDGLEKAKTHHPDLIILDALMPRVDGFTFLRNIKKDPHLYSIPCVLYSAIYTDSKDRELALSLGAATFIAKPTNSEEFWSEIESILERKMQPVAHVEKKMIDDEKEFLKSYNQIVVAKLEEKVKELGEVIAKNKQTEEALQKSETIFKGLFESNPDAIVVVNHEGRIVSVNKTLEMMFGYNRDELLHNAIEVLVPERFRKQHVEYRNGYLSKPIVRAMGKCFGLFARRKDGN
ncbi:MAG: response regulator, partial [Planctomycetota bacterium]